MSKSISYWYPDGDLLSGHPGFLAIKKVLKDRAGCWDLKELMDYAIKNDNIIRLYPGDKEYNYLRTGILGLEEEERKEEFPILINFCLEEGIISKHPDNYGEYLYFDILDYLGAKYSARTHRGMRREKKKEDEELKINALPTIAILLKDNFIWVCPEAQFKLWQEKYPLLDIKERLAHYSDYYVKHPKRRKSVSEFLQCLDKSLHKDELQVKAKIKSQ